MTKNEIKEVVEKKMSKVFFLLAQKYALRKIAKMAHVDRMDVSNIYKMPNIKISFEFADKVAKYVLKYKPNINIIIKKFTKRGLAALIEYKALSEKHNEELLSIKVKKIRETDNISFIEIGKKMKMCTNSAQRLYELSKNNKGKINNILFEKCDKRDNTILQDHKKNGLSTAQLSQKYNLSRKYIRNILCNKFNVVYQHKRLSDENIKRLVELREQYKLTWPAIGYIFNMSTSGVQYYYSDYYIKGGKEQNVNDKVNATKS